MKAIRILLRIFFILLILGGAGGLVYVALCDSHWGRFVGWLAGHSCWCAGAGIMLLTLCFIYLLSFLPKMDKDKYLSFDTEGGSVNISVKAMRDFLGGVGREFPSVLDVHPRIVTVKGAVNVDMDIHVRAGCQVPELSKALQDRVRSALNTNLGLSDVPEVRVVVKEIRATDIPRREMV